MKRLTIPKAPPAGEVMHAASIEFARLSTLKHPAERASSGKTIGVIMAEAPLSDWFALNIRVIFDHIYGADDATRAAFVENVSNLHLNQFSREYHGIPKKLDALRVRRHAFFYQSYCDLRKAIIENDTLCTEITRLEKIYSQPKEDILALFLIVANVVSLMEKQGKLSAAATLAIKEKMSSDSLMFLMKIVPILHRLQGIVPDETAETAMDKLDSAIRATLRLLDFSGDDEALVFLIRDDLFEQKHLGLVDVDVDVDVVAAADDRRSPSYV